MTGYDRPKLYAVSLDSPRPTWLTFETVPQSFYHSTLRLH